MKQHLGFQGLFIQTHNSWCCPDIQFTRRICQGKQGLSYTFLSKRFKIIDVVPIVIKMKTIYFICKVCSDPQAVISLIKNDIFQIIRTEMISGMRIKMLELPLSRLI